MMRFFSKKFATAILAFAALPLWLGYDLYQNSYAQTGVIYSQDQKIDNKIISEIQDAQKYVYFVMYTFSRQSIAEALIAAKIRGLSVKGILDFNQSQIDVEKPIIKKLQSYGIELIIPDKPEGLIHMKLMITDRAYASGSYNWTSSANSTNDEVVEIGKVRSIHDQYLKIFNELEGKYHLPLPAKT